MIHVEQLTKSFNDKIVFKDLSFHINKGETVSVLGPSGSGKSTLIRCLNLLECPDSGVIRLDDLEISLPNPQKTQVKGVRQRTGMVFQSFNLFPHLSALQNITVALTTVQKKSKYEAIEIASQYLDKVGLGAHQHKYPGQLSGGQQQRVAIARSLSLAPRILLMDEPTSALDPELVQEVLSVIKTIADGSITLVIVTHELGFAREISDRIMFIDQGAIVAFEKTEKFFHHSDNERTRRFLNNFSWRPGYMV